MLDKKLLRLTNKGIYCEQADVYFDPWRPVDKAIISHAHADHARKGMKHYLCHDHSAKIINHRLGKSNIETLPYGKSTSINGVKFSFHPAGHVIGSAQIRVEYKGEVWVFTGDYKTEKDFITPSFESVKCHHLITESTFGLPVYQWEEEVILADQINNWWKKNVAEGFNSVIYGYSLGKAQRILSVLDSSIGPIYSHTAINHINELVKSNGYQLPETKPIAGANKADIKNAIIVCPPAMREPAWMRKVKPYRTAMCSGWMAVRGAKRRRNVDKGFVMSDHADWKGLNEAIEASGAENIYVTHGYSTIFAQWLSEKGLNAQPLKTEYEGETNDSNTDE